MFATLEFDVIATAGSSHAGSIAVKRKTAAHRTPARSRRRWGRRVAGESEMERRRSKSEKPDARVRRRCDVAANVAQSAPISTIDVAAVGKAAPRWTRREPDPR